MEPEQRGDTREEVREAFILSLAWSCDWVAYASPYLHIFSLSFVFSFG